MTDAITTTVPTVYGRAIQLALYKNKPAPHIPNSTLNEKLDIAASNSITADERHALNYMVIGRGGHYYEGSVKNYKHKKTDAGLWDQIPFVMRTLDNDLSEEERANYRLRRVEEHDGVTYVVYYGKVIPESSEDISITKITTGNDGSTTEDVFIATSDNLNLNLNDRDPLGTPSNVSFHSSSGFNISLNATDIEELKNVGMILNGDEDYATISELGICFGVDQDVTTNDTLGGNDLVYVESVRTTIAMFIVQVYIQPSMNNAGFERTSTLYA